MWASTYDVLAPDNALGDLEFFREALLDDGQPGLEIGCGTGRLLVPLVEDGLDVEGLELSSEMLELCRQKAAQHGIEVTLHQQDMRSFELPRRYRCIYVPFFSMQVFTELDEARRTLERFHHHLEPAGRVIVPLFLPWKSDAGREPSPADEWCLRREGVDPDDGALVRVWERAQYDFDAQVKRAVFRFEVVRDPEASAAAANTGEESAVAASEEYDVAIGWFTQEQFASMMADAGFGEIRILHEHTWEPAEADDPSFTFIGRRA